MGIEHVVLLVSVGLVAGLVAGLLGIGGGAFFGPVLLFYFDALGVPDSEIAQMTIASSLFCAFVTASSSAVSRHLKGCVDWRVAIPTGLSSGAAVFLMTTFVTTQPWYGRLTFQAVFAAVLFYVAYRMILGDGDHPDGSERPNSSLPRILGIGTAAGSISAAVGVGGGIVMVPLYERFVRLPIHRAMGTSSGTIIFIAGIGMVFYGFLGGPAAPSDWMVGYVDFATAGALALPAALTAGVGVRISDRFDRSRLRRVFSVLVILVAIRLLADVVG